MSVIVDYSRDTLLPQFSKDTLLDGYQHPTESSPQDAFSRAATAYSSNPQHAQRIYNYASKLWFMFSSPILSNGGSDRGLGISCYLNYIPDSIDGIINSWSETAKLTVNGGGIGLYAGALRSDGEETSKGSASNGTIPFLKNWDSQMLAFSQGKTRRGAAAIYQDISHPEIEEFMHVREETGDPNRRFSKLHHAVNITDTFMRAVKDGLPWELIDPHSKLVKKTVDARSLWIKLLMARANDGEPYIHFIDTSNRDLPKTQKALGLSVKQSNLCSEITLPTNEQRTAVCCLSSINLEKYDEWIQDEQFIPDLIEFLDNVLTDFIVKGNKINGFGNAVYSAMRERSLGLGTMGWHYFLQSKNIPIESAMAKVWNNKIFNHIKREAKKKTQELAIEREAAPDSNGNVRNMHLLAIAPNATSGYICGVTTPGIEPLMSNIFTAKTKIGSYTIKNRYLDKIINDRLCTTHADLSNYDLIWESILNHHGSIQHLDFFTADEKLIFKTAHEIDQNWLIEHAADRQKYICQSQSLNLFVPASVSKDALHRLHFSAWEKGIKTLYYLRNTKVRGAEKINNIEAIQPDCLGCES